MEHTEKRNSKPVKDTQQPPNPPSPTKTMFEEMEESGSKIPLMVKILEENGWMSYKHHDNWIKKIWLHYPDVSNMGYSLNDAYKRMVDCLPILNEKDIKTLIWFELVNCKTHSEFFGWLIEYFDIKEKINKSEDDPKNSFYEIHKVTDSDYPNYLHYLHNTKQTQEMCSFLTWVEEGKQMLEIGNEMKESDIDVIGNCANCGVEYHIHKPQLKGKKLIAVRVPYLVKFVDPDKEYPVSYTIKQDGEKINEPSILMGYDLTENQIVELFEKELL